MGTEASRILSIAEPIAAERGLEILDIEIAGSAANRLVRVLLDSPEESRRIGTDDCQDVSRRLGDALEAHEVLGGRYMLEVSSPGVNRPLKRIEHFRRVLGRKVKVRTKSAPGDRHTWLGRLDEVDEEAGAVTVEDETAGTTRIALADIERANLEFEFERFEQKGRRPRRR